MIRPTHVAPGWQQRAGRYIPQAEYNARRWYEIGAQWGVFPQAYYGAHNDGHRPAYLAGVMARAFGVDISSTIL